MLVFLPRRHGENSCALWPIRESPTLSVPVSKGTSGSATLLETPACRDAVRRVIQDIAGLVERNSYDIDLHLGLWILKCGKVGTILYAGLLISDARKKQQVAFPRHGRIPILVRTEPQAEETAGEGVENSHRS